MKTVKDLIEKLNQYNPKMLVGSSYSDSFGNWFCELQLREEFVNNKTELINIFPAISALEKVLVIY